MKIIVILVSLAAYAIIALIKSLNSARTDVKGTPINKEVFPQIDILEQEDNYVYTETPKAPEPTVATKPTGEKPKQDNARIQPTARTPELKAENKCKWKKISLSNRSDAKRAFIEAEIFNRKY